MCLGEFEKSAIHIAELKKIAENLDDEVIKVNVKYRILRVEVNSGFLSKEELIEPLFEIRKRK